MIDEMIKAPISRRDFLKGTFAAMAAIAGLEIVDRENRLTQAQEDESVAPAEHATIVDLDEGGTWIPAACWHNCGGRCMNKVLVKDGIVVRQKTDDTHPDSPDYPQQRGCVRGKAQQQQCFGADRLKYPIKRKSWSPEKPNGELRGLGFLDWDFKPYPEYITPVVGYETTFENGDIDGKKGKYPYLMCNIHYLRSAHSSLDNCPWLRESWARPAFISASDARHKGITDGNTVLVSTKHGKSLRKACVLEGLMPGVVSLTHGAWVNIDKDTGIDLAGADNYLTGNEISASGVTPYNNLNCNIEKYDRPALDDDVNTDRRILEL